MEIKHRWWMTFRVRNHPSPFYLKIYDWSQSRYGKVSRPAAKLFGYLWSNLFAEQIASYKFHRAVSSHVKSLEFQFRLRQFIGRTANRETPEVCARILLRQPDE
ncbi:MAG TPA: hypothetical protein VK497_00415 [Candidatus Saccharimonadales bacterium]|nr:hypothetical protein [Candidatus Saccharimonadales bacterium]